MYALDGKRHMLPYDTGVNVLYYNAELWQRAGLPNPRQQWAAKRWDWAAFLDAATRLSGDEGGGRRYGLGYVGTAPWVLGPFLWQNGGDWADWVQNKQTVDRPPAVEALLFVADLAQKHRVMPSPALNRTEQPTFANGRVAMEMNFSFARATFMKMEGVKWDVAHLPTGKAGNAVHVARNGFSISRASKQPDAAWQCLAFATGREACLQATQAGTVHPPRKSIASSDVFLKPAGVTADFRPFVESVPFGQFGAPHEKRGEINTLLGRTLPEAFDGQKSAQATAADLAPQLQTLLDQGKGFPDVKK
jgi:multiple sugar transport system substrate-binding protein